MIIGEQNFKGCDWCFNKDVAAEYGDVARGATGRHCVVMARCESCLGDETVTPIEEARKLVAKDGDWADF